MLQLPIRVHETWRGEFERRWRRARLLLIIGFGLIPVAVVVAGLVALVLLSSLDAGTDALVVAAAFALVPIGYLWWFLFSGRAGKTLGLWGSLVSLGGLIQSIGVSFLLQDVPREFPQGVGLGVPGGVFLLAALGGIAGWRAHAIMFAGPDEAVAATSLPMKEYAVALVPPLTYTGQLRIDGTSVTWWISWSARVTTPHLKKMAHIGSVPLADIIDARIVPIPEPMRVPPIDHIFDGRPLYPQQGELLLVRTAHGETGIPAEDPRRMYQLLNIRCGLIHATRAAGTA